MRRIARRSPPALLVGLFGFSLLSLVFLSCASLLVGSIHISLDQVFESLRGQGDSTLTAVLAQRLSRTLLGLLVGCALGVAGALMQAFTRNPLAEPGILGVNAGAGFAVTLGVAFFGFTSISSYIWFSFLGSLVTTFVIYMIAHRGSYQASALRLVLVGMALGSVLVGISRTVALLSPSTFDSMRFWGAGTLANRPENVLPTILPFIACGLICALFLARPLNMLAMGEDLARANGVNMASVQTFSLIAITLLSGAATAATGPIAFVGLLIPHLVRSVVGQHQPKIILFSALLAPSLLVGADVLGRVLLAPRELQVGILVSALGAPALIFFIRRSHTGGGG